MAAPQIVMLALIFINLLLSAHLHEKPKDDHNFWADLISMSILSLILWWGGFFN